MSTWKWLGDIQAGTSGQRVVTGSGSPEGAITAPVGSLYMRSDGGTDTSIYIKETGSGNTGWIAIANSGGGGGSRTATIAYVIDGGGSVPTTGVKGQIDIPANCTITGWVITADQSGSAVVDILRSTYSGFPTTSSIAGTDKPTLSSAQKNEDLSLTGWGSTAINAGDQIQFNLSSVTTCTRLNITLIVTIP
jgi:hypothetical protein